MGRVGVVMVDVVGGCLILVEAFVGDVTTTVAVAGKFGETTAAHFDADAVAR